jgi:LPS-assembly protein
MLNLAFLLLFLFQQPDEAQIVIEPGGKQECAEGVEIICTLTGGVTITYQDVVVKADSITYNRTTTAVAADGHVTFTRGEERLEGQKLSLNLTKKNGTINNVSGFVGPGFYFTAGDVTRYEDGRYELRNATVTTCAGPSPGWSFTHGHVWIVPGKSISAGSTVFRLEGVPLFYLPYVLVPTEDRDRSTGFLMPSTSTSTAKGRSVRESFYYSINRSADATFTGEYFSKRGMSGEVSFRAVPNATSRLELSTFFVRDRRGQGGQSARILNYSDLGHGYRGVADMNVVSSFVFRQVFEEGFSLISSPIEQSLAFLTRNQPDYSYNFVYNRTGIFFTDQPTVVTRKWPAFEMTLPAKRVGNLPLYVSLATGAAGVSRRDASMKTDGFVGRFDVYPVLDIPLMKSSAMEWDHQVGLHETLYTDRKPVAGSDSSLKRSVLDYSTRLAGPELERSFGTWRHVFQPTAEYRYAKGANLYRQTIVVDETDLLTDTNEVEYAITNYIFTTREVFSWRVAQQYFFDPTFGGAIRPGIRNQFAPLVRLTGFAFADGTRRFSPIVSNMRLSTSPNTSTDLQIDYDSERHRFESAGISGGLNRGQAFGNVAYFFRRNTAIQFPSNQLRGNFGYGNELKRGLSLALSAAYDVQRSVFQESVTQVGYNWECYGVNLEWMQRDLGARNESRIRFAFSLKNIGTFGNIRRQDRIF